VEQAREERAGAEGLGGCGFLGDGDLVERERRGGGGALLFEAAHGVDHRLHRRRLEPFDEGLEGEVEPVSDGGEGAALGEVGGEDVVLALVHGADSTVYVWVVNGELAMAV
jgi:hypothetical protein